MRVRTTGQRVITLQRLPHKVLTVKRRVHRQNHAGHGLWHTSAKVVFNVSAIKGDCDR